MPSSAWAAPLIASSSRATTCILISLTSGSLRVPDSEADKFAGTLLELSSNAAKPDEWKAQVAYGEEALSQLDAKGEFGEDTPVLRQLKGLILRGELRDAAQALGLDHQHVTFLDLPFYEQGRYRRFKSTQADVDALKKLLLEHKPHQIFLTGDAADPSSVSGITFRLLISALQACTGEEFASACSIWLYRGKERALEAHEIDMAVPMSPLQIERKENALNRYSALSSLEKEAPETNRENARNYDSLGLAEYEAIEVFQRWRRA
jgi:glucosamine-6-phosphate deaminase